MNIRLVKRLGVALVSQCVREMCMEVGAPIASAKKLVLSVVTGLFSLKEI